MAAPLSPDSTVTYVDQNTGMSVAHADGAAFRVSSASDPSQRVEPRPGQAGPLLVGKSYTCDLVIDDPRVSRCHLSLEAVGAFLRVVDLESRNGTMVNGLRVGTALLRGGERIQLGSAELVVEVLQSAVRAKLWPAESFGRVLGRSAAMRQLFPVFQKLAASDVPIIIEGETGTGKGLVAEAIHDAGERKEGPFLLVECSSLDPKLLEIRLFGEARPEGDQPGFFDEAAGGTLVFDEIADLHPLLQAKLVHVLERREVCRVRGLAWTPFDVRIVAITQRNLDEEVERERFREDLFYRLNVGRVRLPALRQRLDDVGMLAAGFWRQLTTEPLPPDILGSYEGYRWPGNVRELYSIVARRVALGNDDVRAPSHRALGEASLERTVSNAIDLTHSFSDARARFLAVFERAYLERALEAHRGNVSRAAAACGVARRYFHVLKRRHGGSGT